MCALFQLVGHGSRADQFPEQSLSYLQSPQEPLQEVAVRFIGEPTSPDSSVLSHVTAEPCRPKAGRALEGFPAALRQPCLCSGWRWEPFWVPRSLPGCCGRMAGAEGMVGGLCWEGGLASGICDGLCVPRARRAAPEKFA